MEQPGLLGLWTRRIIQMQHRSEQSSPLSGALESEEAARLIREYQLSINEKLKATELHDTAEAKAPQLRAIAR